MNQKSRYVKILSVKNSLILADECYVANSFFDRVKGLLGGKLLAPGQGMLLRPCNDIHMWFMKIPLDVVFMHTQGGKVIVTSVRKNLQPWKVLPVRDGRASETLELPVGTIERCDLRPGDELCIS